jgi:hypothetical protein
MAASAIPRRGDQGAEPLIATMNDVETSRVQDDLTSFHSPLTITFGTGAKADVIGDLERFRSAFQNFRLRALGIADDQANMVNFILTDERIDPARRESHATLYALLSGLKYRRIAACRRQIHFEFAVLFPGCDWLDPNIALVSVRLQSRKNMTVRLNRENFGPAQFKADRYLTDIGADVDDAIAGTYRNLVLKVAISQPLKATANAMAKEPLTTLWYGNSHAVDAILKPENRSFEPENRSFACVKMWLQLLHRPLNLHYNAF